MVPKTHRIPNGPSQIFARGAFRCSGKDNFVSTGRPHDNSSPGTSLTDCVRFQGVDALHQTLMPNYVEAALPAGCGIAFDSHIWHTSMPNTSGVNRRCAYFGYRSSGRFWPQQPTWGEAGQFSMEES